MSDAYVQIATDGSGKKIDNDSLTVSSNTVYRQRIINASPSTAAGLAEVINVAPSTEYGLAVWGHMRYAKPTTSDLLSAVINISSSGDNTVIAGVAATTIRIYKLFFVAQGSVNVFLKDGASNTLTGGMALNANGVFVLPLDSEPWVITATANNFVINLSGAVVLAGRVYYTQS
jgi:hypothetical protein